MAVLGSRHWYRYDSEDGKCYKISLLDYLAEAAGFELDDTLPFLPRNIEPRYVWLQEAEPTGLKRPIRKKLIIQRKDVAHFRKGASVEVAGIKMVAQGYQGECHRGIGSNDNVVSEVRVEMRTETSTDQ
ncbi:MAG TPA: hypothetical protein V6C81_13915 [Planktothrix sp.]|jgi:hypothetical protein